MEGFKQKGDLTRFVFYKDPLALGWKLGLQDLRLKTRLETVMVWVMAGGAKEKGCIQRFLGEQIAWIYFIHCGKKRRSWDDIQVSGWAAR